MLDFLHPKMSIDASPDIFVFSTSKNQFSIEPIVYIDPENHKPVAMGENTGIPSNIIKVQLFKPQELLTQSFSKYQILTAFIGYGIGRSYMHILVPFPRPIVNLHGVDRFEPVLCGYQREFFFTAITEGGAWTVRFE